MNRRTGLVFTLALALVGTASAQVATKKSLDLNGARKVIAAAVAEAQRLKAPGGVIAVVDDGGNLMALERLDGTFAAGANISIGKARTAALFKKPTKVFEDAIKSGRTSMVTLGGDLQNFTPLQGGIPLEWEGKNRGCDRRQRRGQCPAGRRASDGGGEVTRRHGDDEHGERPYAVARDLYRQPKGVRLLCERGGAGR